MSVVNHIILQFTIYHQFNNQEVNINKENSCALVMMGQVHCKDRNVVNLFDPGGTKSLTTHRTARELGLWIMWYTL